MIELERNQGKAWKQDLDEGSKKPNITGQVDVEGKRFDIAIWYYPPKSAGKKPFFSIRVQEPRRRDDHGDQQPQPQRQSPNASGDGGSEIPF